MASNRISYNCGILTALGTNNAVGLGELATTLGITQITAAQMTTAVTALSTAETAYITARSTLATASTACKAEAALMAEWLSSARGVLTAIFGASWSNEWLQAGFPNTSTAVPKSMAARVSLVASLVNYFTANPTSQAPAQQVTAAKASDIHYAVTVAQLAVQAAKVSMGIKKMTRTAACMALRKKIRLLITTLAAILSPDDSRWATFGFNLPGADTTPGQPEDLEAEAMGGGIILVQCSPVPLATRYRWRVRVPGIEADYTLAKSTTAPMAEITNFLPGPNVQIIVQAVNGGAQGVASEPITVPVTAAAHAGAPALSTAPTAPVSSHVLPRNGSNGAPRKKRSRRAGAH